MMQNQGTKINQCHTIKWGFEAMGFKFWFEVLSKNCGLPFPSFFPVDLPASSLDANKTCLHMLSQWLRLSLDNDCSKLTMLSLMSARKRGSTSASNNVNSTPETNKTVMNKGKRE